MAWIESHQEIRQHPKTHALMELMGWSLYETVGRLHAFWYWCLDYAPTGDLRKFNDAVLAGSVGLAPEDGKRFVDAMVESCWIDRDDETFRVHDWPDYAGKYLKGSKFKRQPEKWIAVLNLYKRKRPETVPRLSRQPTNQPNHVAGARESDGNGHRTGSVGDDDLDRKIRAHFRSHNKLEWHPKAHGKFRELVELRGWDGAVQAVDEAVTLEKPMPVGWALTKALRNGSVPKVKPERPRPNKATFKI